MTHALREELGRVAYAVYYGRLAHWETASEREREHWRDVGMATAEVAVILAARVSVKAILRDEMAAVENASNVDGIVPRSQQTVIARDA